MSATSGGTGNTKGVRPGKSGVKSKLAAKPGDKKKPSVSRTLLILLSAVLLVLAIALFLFFGPLSPSSLAPELRRNNSSSRNSPVETDAPKPTETPVHTTGAPVAVPSPEATDYGPADPPSPVETPHPLSAAQFLGDLGDYSRLMFDRAEASSTVDSYNGETFYEPENVFDEEVTTSWQEGSSGYGIGEYLKLYFDGTVSLKILSFRMGSYSMPGYFEMNGKPRELMLEFSDGSMVSYEFPETDQVFLLELSESISTQWVKITIVSAYPGSQWEDTSIAEIRAFGEA